MRWTRSTVFRVRSLFFTYARPPPPGKRGCVCLGRAHKCQSVAVSARAGSRRPAALQPVASPRPFEHSVYSRTVVSVTMWSLSTCSSRFRRRRRLPFRWFSCARPPTHGGHPSCRPDRIFVCRRLPRLSHKPLRHRTSSFSPPSTPSSTAAIFVCRVRAFVRFIYRRTAVARVPRPPVPSPFVSWPWEAPTDRRPKTRTTRLRTTVPSPKVRFVVCSVWRSAHNTALVCFVRRRSKLLRQTADAPSDVLAVSHQGDRQQWTVGNPTRSRDQVAVFVRTGG